MELNSDIILLLVLDYNKWKAIKCHAIRNDINEIQSMHAAFTSLKDTDLIANYDPTLAINVADAIYNYCNAN